jgi:hypothetical protein
MPTRRVVILGASNLVRNLGTVVETIRQMWREPLDIVLAMGHGRSYGMESAFFLRRLPGILDCGIWESIRERPPLPTFTLVTDIGNDILFGVPVERVLTWVDECLARLEACQSTTIMTELPMASIARLGTARYLFYRTLFVPRARYSLEQIRESAMRLNDGLLELGQRRKIPVFPASGDWYGLDPIHVRRASAPAAWSTICAAWSDADCSVAPVRSSRWFDAYLAALPSAERCQFGKVIRHAQPSGLLCDGTAISLY